MSELLDLRRRVALSVMLTGIFVTIMDSSIVNVAIPSIRSTLGASFAEAELVIAGYAFTLAVGLITGGRLGDIFGQRRMFLVGFGAFILSFYSLWPGTLAGGAHYCPTPAKHVGGDSLATGLRTGAGDLR